MNWNDLTEDQHAEWLAMEETRAFLKCLESAARAAHEDATSHMRQISSLNAGHAASRKIGEMDAYMNAKRTAETFPGERKGDK